MTDTKTRSLEILKQMVSDQQKTISQMHRDKMQLLEVIADLQNKLGNIHARCDALTQERDKQHQLKEQALDELASIRRTPTTWDDGHAAGYRSAEHNWKARTEAAEASLAALASSLSEEQKK